MKQIWIALLVLLCQSINAQESLKFTVAAGDFNCYDCPVSVILNPSDFGVDQENSILYEIVSGKEISTPCQFENGYSTKLWFVLSGATAKNEKRKFILKKGVKTQFPEKICLLKDNQDLRLVKDGKPILTYRYAITLPPKNVDPLFQRSGYIHPLVSPGGEELTRIGAPDHYHHFGIWGPWTKTHIEKREVDFWNLNLGQGTVQFSGFISEVEGNVFSGFNALQQHIDFGAKGSDQIALNENLGVRAWNIQKKRWLVDYTTSFNCPLDSGIMFDAYRYGGGIGFRATEKWTKDNCTVLTSEGKTRIDADGSNARWCLVEGESSVSEGRSGILFLSYPTNRMHPEPMRIWPEDANGGRGDMYFEFCPIRHNNWKIEKGKDYSLNYRMVVFDGKLSAQEAEAYWQAFAKPPKVIIEK